MKLLTATLLLIIASNTVFAQPLLNARTNARTTDLVETWRKISSFYPRHEAGSGEAATRELIKERLAQLDIGADERGFGDFEGAHSFSRVIEATIEGTRADRVIIAVPLNHRYGASRESDGSVGIAAALQLAAELSRDPPPLTVTLLFLGGEREPLPGYPLGSRLFVSQRRADGPAALVYLDLRRPGDPIALDTAAGGIVAPSWLLQGLADALARSGVGFDAQTIASQIQRVGMTRDPAAIAAYLEAGIPAIGIRGHTPDAVRHSEVSLQPVESIVDGLQRFIDSYPNGLPSEWDRHYVFFQAGNSLYILGEQLYLMIFLALIAATLFYAVAFRHRFERYVQSILRNFWSIPAVYLLLFVLLLIATATLESFLEYRSYPALWHHQPLNYFALKLSITLFLFALSMLPLRRSLLPSTSSFYSAAALAVLFVAIVVLAVAHISFSYYFLWAFLWAFLFAVLPTRPLKIVCLALAPLPLLHTAYVVYSSGELTAGRVFLLSPISGNLLTALIVLPFLLMLLRLDFLVRHPRVGRRSFVLQLTAFIAALCVAGLAVAIARYQPYDERSPRPVALHEYIDLVDNSRTLDVSGNGQLPQTLALRIDGRTVLWNGRPIVLQPADTEPLLSIERQRSSFLERNRLQYTITTNIELYRVEAEIESEASLLLYDANLPVSIPGDAERASVFVGVLPPNPFTIDITLPEQVQGSLLLLATSKQLSRDVTVLRPDVRIGTTELTIRARADL